MNMVSVLIEAQKKHSIIMPNLAKWDMLLLRIKSVTVISVGLE